MDNFSQYNVMQKIEELREKQRQEEEKLLRQQEEQRKLLNIKQQKLYEVLGFQNNGYVELQNNIGLQSDSTKHCSGSFAPVNKRNEVTSMKDAAEKSFDETPAANPNANFLQLLQDTLNQQEDCNINVPPNKGKTKKKFLKKGEGLARFRMKPTDFQLKSRISNVEKTDHERKSELDQTTPKHSYSAKKNANDSPLYESTVDKKHDECLKEINPENYGFKVALNSYKPHASWTAVQRKDHYSPGKDSIENSFLEKVEEAERKSKKELEELKVFELLEEQAQNSSFCSNSSLFAHLMNDTVKSTPLKTQDTKNRHLLLGGNREDVLAGNCFSNSELDLLYHHLNQEEQENIPPKDKNSFVYTSNLKNKKQQNEAAVNNLHVHFSDKNDYKSYSEEISYHSEEGNSTVSGERELKLSDLRNKYGDFQDDDVWSDGCVSELNKSDCSVVTLENVPTSSEENVEAGKHNLKSNVNNATVCSLCSELIDKMAMKCMKETGVNTELESEDIQFQASVLQTKLKDLEKEIEIFRMVNTNLQKAQQQHQQEVTKFSREKKDLENKMKEEREQLETALQDERKKLQRQKMVFDRYCKETRKNPSKQEREEIQTLKLKIQELQEVIHKKNCKWSSFQARSREREKFLEKENRHLKEELEVFKKAKATQKAKTIKHHQISKTKILHAINDHIAKLTPDDLEDAIVIHDVIPKKVSPTCSTNFSKALTNGTNVSEEVNQHEADLSGKNVTIAQGYFDSPRECVIPTQNSKTESYLSPVQLSNADLSSQNSVQESKQESYRRATNCKQDRIKSIGSAYTGYSYFLPKPSSRKTYPETDNYEQPVGKTLRSESHYDSALSEKITDSYGALSGKSVNHSESKQMSNKTQQSQSIKSTSSKSSESVMDENRDSMIAESLTPKNMPDYVEKCDVIEKITAEGGREKIYPDGRKEIWYANGNVKKISADRSTSKTIFYNGDVRERLSDGTVKYYFAETKVWQTTNPDGSELMEYSNGQVELRMADGTMTTTFPDLSECTVYSDGRQKHVYKDGKVMEKNPLLGTEITSYPNGQLEICSKDHMRLEYPDGTVKILYPDGLQETRYSNGRIRLKDKDGKLIMDSLRNETDSFNSQGNVT